MSLYIAHLDFVYRLSEIAFPQAFVYFKNLLAVLFAQGNSKAVACDLYTLTCPAYCTPVCHRELFMTAIFIYRERTNPINIPAKNSVIAVSIFPSLNSLEISACLSRL
jgi:hypothetical protein